MKNQSVSDFVAATMDAVLNSKEHKSLFGTQYKFAQDLNAAKKKKDEDKDSCMADDDDNDARKKKDEDKDSCMADDDNDARRGKKKDSDDESSADDDNDARKKKDDDNDAKKKKMPPWLKKDDSDADDNDDKDASQPVVSNEGAKVEFKQPAQISAKPAKADDHSADMEPSMAFDVAIDSLLTASAALDALHLGRGSALTLKIASLVVEAKKKDKDSKKSKKDSKDSKKSSKDSQSAKDKKSKDSNLCSNLRV